MENKENKYVGDTNKNGEPHGQGVLVQRELEFSMFWVSLKW